ncbi:MAG: hypothetical protein MUE40_16595 [Anaerolineae bacterium]|nr:hypothetical protein [Anaerolineae bacterium]
MPSDDATAATAAPPPGATAALQRWRCPNCGQQHFTAAEDTPPDICAGCRDMTTWQRVPAPPAPDEPPPG